MKKCFLLSIAIFALTLAGRADEKSAPGPEDLKALMGFWKGGSAEVDIDGKKVDGYLCINIIKHDILTLGYWRDGGEIGREELGKPYAFKLTEQDKKRYLVLEQFDEGGDLEVQFERSGDKLKLTASRKVSVIGVKKPVDISGDWKRVAKEKK